MPTSLPRCSAYTTTSLNHPFDEFTEFKLNQVLKCTSVDTQSCIDQLIAPLITSNRSTRIRSRPKSNKTCIDNNLGHPLAVIDETKEFEPSINEIDGANKEKLYKLWVKGKEVNEKQGEINKITSIYQDLEKDDFRLSIKKTPSSIMDFFGNMYAQIKNLI